jgi:hypothetical protein
VVRWVVPTLFAANVYVDEKTLEAKVDIFPFLDGAIGTAHPLVKEFPVAKALYMFPAGHAFYDYVKSFCKLIPSS